MWCNRNPKSSREKASEARPQGRSPRARWRRSVRWAGTLALRGASMTARRRTPAQDLFPSSSRWLIRKRDDVGRFPPKDRWGRIEGARRRTSRGSGFSGWNSGATLEAAPAIDDDPLQRSAQRCSSTLPSQQWRAIAVNLERARPLLDAYPPKNQKLDGVPSDFSCAAG